MQEDDRRLEFLVISLHLGLELLEQCLDLVLSPLRCPLGGGADPLVGIVGDLLVVVPGVASDVPHVVLLLLKDQGPLLAGLLDLVLEEHLLLDDAVDQASPVKLPRSDAANITGSPLIDQLHVGLNKLFRILHRQ